MTRKIIQLTKRTSYLGKEELVALCDDGTLWEYDDLAWARNNPPWRKIQDIPGEESPCEE